MKKKSIEIITGELGRLEKKHGTLIPQTVVDSARTASSPLHRYFEWDDTIAAQKYRLEQARDLIQLIVYQPENMDEPMRKYVNVVLPGNSHKYLFVEDALRNKELREQVLSRAKAEARVFAVRYSHLLELAELIGAIKRLLHK